MPTIRDVAFRSGVSIKTVSRVINAPDTVTDVTRGRVLAAVEDLDFVPDQRASAMRSGRSHMIGFVSDLVATTPHSVDIIRGAQHALAERGKTMLLANADGGGFQAHLRGFHGLRVDGVIVATMYHRAIDDLPPLSEPAVLVNCFEATLRFPAILPDDAQAGYRAARHLIARGHRRIAFVTLPREVEATRLRLDGYHCAHADANLPVIDDLVAEGVTRTADGGQIWHAFETAAGLLDRDPAPDAIVCGNDIVAMHVYNAVRARGLAIPDDISVMGFDDNVVVSTGLMPTLSTVALPYAAMGRTAVSLLLDRQAGGGAAVHRIDCPLIARESCRDRTPC